MLDILEKHLAFVGSKTCVVGRWIFALKPEEQTAFKKIMEAPDTVNLAILFTDLNKNTELPFKLTAFRSHIRGYCTCQK